MSRGYRARCRPASAPAPRRAGRVRALAASVIVRRVPGGVQVRPLARSSCHFSARRSQPEPRTEPSWRCAGPVARPALPGPHAARRGRAAGARGGSPHGLDPVLGRLDGVLAERELVELPHAVPARLVQCVEELERLHQVDRADDHVVVPAAVVVVDVDREQSVARHDQLAASAGDLSAVEGVAEVEQDADVVATGLLDREQGDGRARRRTSGCGARAACTRWRTAGRESWSASSRTPRPSSSTGRGGWPGTGSRSRPDPATASRSRSRVRARDRPARETRSIAAARTSGSGLVKPPFTNCLL